MHESDEGQTLDSSVVDASLHRASLRGDPDERFSTLDLIGRGGMGEVWRAWDPRLQRTVAMKKLRAHQTNSLRFLKEAQITGALQHPGVLPVYEVGTDARGDLYFAMREVKGRSLAALVGTLPLVRLVGMMVRVCETVAYAHHRGVVHRALKPDNIMVADFGEVLVVDWGLATLVDEGETTLVDVEAPQRSSGTRAGTVLGTVGFMPPEQALGEGERVGPASDIFSLGATLFTICTGAAPFGDLESTIACRPVDPKGAPRELCAVMQRAMAADPSDRYASVDELGDELQAWLDGRPLRSVEYGLARLLWLWARRYRRPLLAAGLIVIIASIASIVGVSKYLRDTEAEASRARLAERKAEATLAQSELSEGLAMMAAQRMDDARSPLRRAAQRLAATGQRPAPALLALWATDAFSPEGQVYEGPWPEPRLPYGVELHGQGEPRATLLREDHEPLDLGPAYALWFDERWAVPASHWSPTYLWDLERGEPHRELCPVRCRGFGSGDGDPLLAVYDELSRTLRLERIETGELLWSRPLPDAQAVAWTDDAIVIGGDLPTLFVLSRSGAERMRLGGHKAAVRDLQVHDGRLLSRDVGGTILSWDLPLTRRSTVEPPFEASHSTVTDGRLYVSGGDRLAVYDGRTLELELDAQLPFGDTHEILATDSDIWALHAMSVIEGGHHWSRLDPADGSLRSTGPVEPISGWSLAGEQALLAAPSGELALGRPGEAKVWSRPGILGGIAWASATLGDYAAITCWSARQLLVVDLAEGSEVARIDLPKRPYGLDISADGVIAVGLLDGSIALVHDALGGAAKPSLSFARGHRGVVAGVAFSEAGDVLASASFDRTLRLWDPTSGEEIASQEFQGPLDGVHTVEGYRWIVREETKHFWAVHLPELGEPVAIREP